MRKYKYIKVAEGIIKRSNDLSCWSVILFFLKLKYKRSDGYFKNISEVARFLKVSYSCAYKNITFLKNIGLVKEMNGLYLAKYDNLFEYLGYDMSIKYTKKGIRRGNFKIYKIRLDKIEDLEDLIIYKEVKLKSSRQNFAINKLLTQKRKGYKKIVNKFKFSCREASNLFGFTSSSTGHNFLHKIEKRGWINIERCNDEIGLPIRSTILFS